MQRFIWAITILAMTTAVAWAQERSATAPQAPLLQTKFTADEGGWKAFGQGVSVMRAYDETQPEGRKNFLQFNYTVDKGSVGFLVLPVNDGEITGARSFRFAVKADAPATLSLTLQERDGGRYVASFSVPGDKWQSVALGPSDFVLAEGKDDPKDPDGVLDMAKVNSVGIVDFGQFFAQSEDPVLLALFNVKKGRRTLLLSDFTVGRQYEPGASFSTASDTRLDTFGHPQTGWISMGGAELSIVSGKPLTSRGLQASYRQFKDKPAGIWRSLPQGRFQGKEKLSFTLASARPSKLVVQLEEPNGNKFNVQMDVPGNATVKEYTIPLSEFKPAQDSKDRYATLNPNKINVVLLMDITGLYTQMETDNTVWLSDLKAVP